MKKFRSILWGVALVTIGIILGLNALNLTNINLFFDGWWTLFIIVPCFIGLFQDEGITGNVIGLLIGVAFLLGCQGVLSFELTLKLMFPTILVILGISIIFKDLLHSKLRKEMSKLNKNSDNSYCATFGGQKINFDNEEFKGCDLTAVFGGVTCDLREAIIKEDVIITTSSIFGGIDIYVPSNVKVKVTGTPIFGGVDNKYKNPKDEKVKTIYINSTCIFGGVDIK